MQIYMQNCSKLGCPPQEPSFGQFSTHVVPTGFPRPIPRQPRQGDWPMARGRLLSVVQLACGGEASCSPDPRGGGVTSRRGTHRAGTHSTPEQQRRGDSQAPAVHLNATCNIQRMKLYSSVKKSDKPAMPWMTTVPPHPHLNPH